jgi:large-conductance mechanosensitive channel
MACKIKVVNSCLFLFSAISGGDSDYFIDSIKNFKIKHSVFDLALLAFVKVIIHSLALSILESVTLKLIDFPLKGSLHTTSKLLHFLHIVLSFGSLVYTVVKGGFVLNEILHEETYERMHSTYNVLLICAVAFSLIEFGAFLYGVKAMKNLEVIICIKNM